MVVGFGACDGEEGYDIGRKYERSCWVSLSKKPRTNREEEETDEGEGERREKKIKKIGT